MWNIFGEEEGVWGPGREEVWDVAKQAKAGVSGERGERGRLGESLGLNPSTGEAIGLFVFLMMSLPSAHPFRQAVCVTLGNILAPILITAETKHFQ